MIHKAKDLSPEEQVAIERLLGRAVEEDEAISVRAFRLDEIDALTEANSKPAPDWLEDSWKTAKQLGVDHLSMEEIDTEIKASRDNRRARTTRQ
jgi:hypothetical protein